MAEKKIPQMTQAEIEEDIKFNQEIIERAKSLKEAGFYEQNEIEAETVYAGWAMKYAGLGMAYALHADWALAKEAFQTAAEYQLKPLQMAYDPDYPDFLGDAIAEGGQAISVVDCFNYAMAAGDLAIAKQACGLFPAQWRPRNSKPGTADDFVHALHAWFSGDKLRAAGFCQKSMEAYIAKPSKKVTGRSNYYTLHLALWGIIINDQSVFDTGIQKQLEICHHEARYGEWKGMVEGHFAEYALALTNLAIQAGMKHQVIDPFIPEGLVWQQPR
ncbi:immunity protein 49 of polymorphic toxin system [Shewanella putrefaciens]|nr:immunity protein 49 of polymorphic toxin system [Shewanella putrefaciens]